MLLKNVYKSISQTSRLMYDYSFKKRRPFQNKLVHRNALLDELEINKEKPASEWKLIRQEFLNDNKITENSVDAVILGHCISKNNYSLGSSYINFLNKENIKFTLAASGKYFKLLYFINKEDRFVSGNSIKKDQEQFILKKFNEIRQQHKILDSITLEGSISALSLTNEWKKCLDLLNEIKVTTTPPGNAYSNTVSAAFLNNEESLGWSLLQEMVLLNRNIDEIVYFAYINYLKKLETGQNRINQLEKLFLFLEENDIVLNSSGVLLKIAELGKELDLENMSTKVTNKGMCTGCKNYLEKFRLTDEEFAELKNTIFKNVIIGKDIFSKTDPKEVERFKEFVTKQEKFDVVLDGLNVAYSAGTGHSTQVLSGLVASLVSHFVHQDKKVLVVGRYHMNQWHKENWNYITQNSTVFLTKNISQDDPYLLYCALNSGKDTIIVTRDLMRGHKFLLKDPKLRILFNKWLSQKQYQLMKVTGPGKPIFRYPPAFTLNAQKIGDNWHIPFKDMSEQINWMCIKCQTSF